jgi:hypothetical protein
LQKRHAKVVASGSFYRRGHYLLKRDGSHTGPAHLSLGLGLFGCLAFALETAISAGIRERIIDLSETDHGDMSTERLVMVWDGVMRLCLVAQRTK